MRSARLPACSCYTLASLHHVVGFWKKVNMIHAVNSRLAWVSLLAAKFSQTQGRVSKATYRRQQSGLTVQCRRDPETAVDFRML
jgi:hypothetical protein